MDPVVLYFVVVINYHKLGSLKQCIFTLLQLWKPEFPNQFHWGQVKVLAGLLPLQAPGKSLILPPTGSRGYRNPLLSVARSPFLDLQRQQ